MNKKQLTERCRQILYSYNYFEPVTELSDIEFLISVFEMHPEWEKKQGVGFDYIFIDKSIYRNKHFSIKRLDGTHTDISFTKAITNPTKRSQILKACRSAVRDTIVKFRDENVVYGKTVCPFTYEVLTKDNTHIDHYNDIFINVFNGWVDSYDIDRLHLHVNKTVDNCTETYFTNQKVIDAFLIYHNNHTNLRAVSKTANLSILKRLQP